MGDRRWLTERPVAHRGLHDAASGIVENTPSAVDAAIAKGCAIEVDVQLSRDGEAMVFHDFTLERLTQAQGPLAARDAAALCALPFKATADRMMTLPELFARVDGRTLLLIEIKSDFSGDMRLARRAAALAAAYGGPVALMSFDPRVVGEVARVAPSVTRGITAERHYDHPEWDALSSAMKRRLGHLAHWPTSRFQFIAYKVADLPTPGTLVARALGMPVLAWTVRTKVDRDVASRHADQMIFEGFTP